MASLVATGCLSVPAGGMALERVEEMLASYGTDVALLIGGALLSAGDDLVSQARVFSRRVAEAATQSAGPDA